MPLKETYKTRDLYEAAFIYAHGGVDFVGLEPAGRDCLFVFGNEEACKQLTASYYNRQGTVQGKDFSDAIKTLKDLIFNRLRERQSRPYSPAQ